MNTIKQPPRKRIKCLVYSRIVGYLRPVQNWNDAKQLEFKDRQVYAQPTREALR